MTNSFAAEATPTHGLSRSDPVVVPTEYSDAFADVFERNWVPLFRLAALTTGSRSDAEEIAQEAFVKWYARRSSIENHDAYLRTIVVNLANGRYRKHVIAGRYLHLFTEQIVSDTTFTEHAELLEIIGQLPVRQRAAVVLRYYEGRTESEIADILRCRPGTVKSLLSRAFNDMRRVLTTKDPS
jgi:RNA polymerase sigma factor (sigma-70 family)